MRIMLGLVVACGLVVNYGRAIGAPNDVHSYANPEHVRVRHIDLDLTVHFDRQRLAGHVTLTLERTSGDTTQPLVLDSGKLLIERVETSVDGKQFQAGQFRVGRDD